MSKNVNRRRFLKQSAAAGALAMVGCAANQKNQAWRTAGPVMTPRRGPNEEVRVAVIGMRGQGAGHIANYLKLPNVRVVALCDIDENLWGSRAKMVTDAGQHEPRLEYDLRRLLDDKDIDCVSIATPNHWHALAGIWACQAGKDVYVEKPCSHNIYEGRKLVEAAHKYNRVMQHGTQSRSIMSTIQAIKMLHDGVIGEVYMARALCYKPRGSIGIKPDQPAPPPGVHYDIWLGPAPTRPFNENRFHYNWHWNWAYGNGDIGNQGIHQVDVARWGLGKQLPVRVCSMGGRYTYEDQGETPNTQTASLQYEDGKMLEIEVRGRLTNTEWDVGIGNLFYGSRGYMCIRSTGGGFETVVDGKPGPKGSGGGNENFLNFIDVVRSRKFEEINAPIIEGHYSAATCHLANVSYRLQRSLEFDPKKERFVGDAEANKMLTREYRKPFAVPDVV